MSTLDQARELQEAAKPQPTGAVDDAWSKYASVPVKAFVTIADGEMIPNIYNSVKDQAYAVVEDPGKLLDLTKQGAISAAKFVTEECQQHPQAASFLLGLGAGVAAAAFHMKIRLRFKPTAANHIDGQAIADRPLAAPKLEPGFDDVRTTNLDAFATKSPVAREIAPARIPSADEISINPPGYGAADGVSTRQYSSLSAALERMPVATEVTARPGALPSRLSHIDRGAAMPKALNLDEIMKQQAEMRAAGQSTEFSPSPWLQFDRAVEAVQSLAK